VCRFFSAACKFFACIIFGCSACKLPLLYNGDKPSYYALKAKQFKAACNVQLCVNQHKIERSAAHRHSKSKGAKAHNQFKHLKFNNEYARLVNGCSVGQHLFIIFILCIFLYTFNKTNMAHFTISLPGNRLGDVWCGKVRKFELPFRWLFAKNRNEKTGYIIKVHSGGATRSEYRLFKTKSGTWFQDADETQQIEDATAIAIKEAIEQKENSST
jgi:hypothetical protein